MSKFKLLGLGEISYGRGPDWEENRDEPRF